MTFIRTMIQRPALVSVIYLIILIFGLFSYTRLPIDMLPDMEAPVVTVVTAYPGASALDIEDKISTPIEESLGSLSNLKEISSTSRENISMVTMVFNSSADINVSANDVRQNLEGLKNSLPRDANQPMVMKFDFGQMPIIIFTIRSEGKDIRLLRDEIDSNLVEPLQRVDGVGAVMLRNAPEKIVKIDVNRERLLSYGLTMSELAQLIGANNMNIPAGDLQIGNMSFALRLPSEAKSLEELAQMPLMKSPIGDGIIKLTDVATIRLELEEVSEEAFADGEIAILGYVRKTSDANVVDVTDKALAVFDRAEKNMSGNVNITVMEDGASFIRGTIANLQNTITFGAVFVSIIVFAFLRRWEPTFIVSLSIPASMIVTFLVVYACGYTLNSVTLIGLSLSVGMVVDNGVVALENISRKLDEGLSPKDAAFQGASEVGGALLASTTTTLVIFAPMIFISGIVGQMFAQLAVVMIVTISASLFVALTLTPTLASRLLKQITSTDEKNIEDESVENALSEEEHHISLEESLSRATSFEKVYVKALRASIVRPWLTIASAVMIAVVTVVLLSQLGSDFLPKDDLGQLAFTVELPVGSTMDDTIAVGNLYANTLRKQPEVEGVTMRVGNSSNGGMGEKEGLNVARVRARLVSAKKRERSDQQIGEAVMASVGELPEVINLEMSRDGTGAGALGATKPIVVEILGNDLQELQEAALLIQREIKNIDGTVNVVADLLQTKPELQIQIDNSHATSLGIPSAVAGQELRLAMRGGVVSRYTGDNKPRDVILRLREEDRNDAQSWKQIPVRTQTGTISQLGEISSQDEGESPIQILRKDKARMLTVSTELSGRALGDVAADVESMLERVDLGEGIRTQMAGAIKDQRESFGDMGLLGGMGMLLVYLVLVAQFESWLSPFVIMFSVPFAATGAFLALLLTGTNLSVTSFLGLIILIGVVVNNAIVLIDYIQLLQQRGMDVISSVILAGQRRLRPVLITTLTTAGGMLPLAMTKGEGEQLWGPMGKTALGGLLVSSVVTLLLIPSIYIIMQKIQGRK